MPGWRRAWMVVLAAPVLAGCLALDAQVEIHTDNTVRYQATLTVTRAYLERIGVGAEGDVDLCGSLAWWFSGDVTTERLETPEVVGCRVRGVAIVENVGQRTSPRSGLLVSHEDGLYTFVWNPRPAAGAPSGLSGFEVSVTFPGEVVEHNGSSIVAWNTVTWRDRSDLFRPPGLIAKGREQPGPLAATLPFAGLLGLAVLVIWATGALPRRRRDPNATGRRVGSGFDGGLRPVGVSPGIDGTGSARPRRLVAPPPPQAWAPLPEDLAEPTGPGGDPGSTVDPDP